MHHYALTTEYLVDVTDNYGEVFERMCVCIDSLAAEVEKNPTL